ncbi:TRAP transporter substrate-binding protein [Yoonia sp. BS5-3]|uniref:TRAP transporter substrate-binding protein n=1 Tax=Yoonia phaeophyticola TaxID=3137369 RepID=A0ABZ2V8N7_9RHOB
MLNTITRTVTAGLAALTLTTAAAAQQTNLRIQTHFSTETLSGQMAAEFVDDVQTMSNGEIQIEMFYSGSVVNATETFDAAVTGILDCDMTGGAYQVGKNPAFQFAGDLNGAYSNPYQMYAWMLHGGGYDAINALYNPQGMEFVGWWIPGPESLSSTAPLGGVSDLEGWKFRAPPGVITMIFEKLGASPIVMDFNEIFTALETGIIDGADASNLPNNVGLGLYDIATHANYPGFHSMPADHLACRKDVWDGMPEHHRAIMRVAMQALGLKNTTVQEIASAEAANDLRNQGVTLHTWSDADMQTYRNAVAESWDEYATTPESKSLLESHLSFLQSIGAL